MDEANDHIPDPPDAEITLVEYGSYDDAFSRVAHEGVAKMHSRFGNRMVSWRNMAFPVDYLLFQ